LKKTFLASHALDQEQGVVDSELMKIMVKLANSPGDYPVNNPNKKIGTLLGAKA
jgi:hypothetical protein